MTNTSNLGMALLESSQAQKEVTINEALVCLDAMISGAVLDKDLATPPGSPAAGAVYIVAASPTGAWAGKATYIAYYDQVWRFIAPATGMRVWVRDELQYYTWSGTAWVAQSATDVNGVNFYATGNAVVDGVVAIGASSAAASAKIEVASTTQGVLFPRMTTTQKNAISSPAEGLVVYDTSLHKLCVRTAGAWESITSV